MCKLESVENAQLFAAKVANFKMDRSCATAAKTKRLEKAAVVSSARRIAKTTDACTIVRKMKYYVSMMNEMIPRISSFTLMMRGMGEVPLCKARKIISLVAIWRD